MIINLTSLPSFLQAHNPYIALRSKMFLGFISLIFYTHTITYQGSVACTSLVICYLEIMCVRSLMLSSG